MHPLHNANHRRAVAHPYILPTHALIVPALFGVCLNVQNASHRHALHLQYQTEYCKRLLPFRNLYKCTFEGKGYYRFWYNDKLQSCHAHRLRVSAPI